MGNLKFPPLFLAFSPCRKWQYIYCLKYVTIYDYLYYLFFVVFLLHDEVVIKIPNKDGIYAHIMM
ncbi:hypothetical protein JOC33_003742 [Thalassobacillus pellis]|nr:hypothetical protein [Thalassobacillus pellis]